VETEGAAWLPLFNMPDGLDAHVGRRSLLPAQRAGRDTKKGISLAARELCTARYHHEAGGEPQLLQELLGYAGQAAGAAACSAPCSNNTGSPADSHSLQHRPGRPDEQQGEPAAAGSLQENSSPNLHLPGVLVCGGNSRGRVGQPAWSGGNCTKVRRKREVDLHRV